MWKKTPSRSWPPSAVFACWRKCRRPKMPTGVKASSWDFMIYLFCTFGDLGRLVTWSRFRLGSAPKVGGLHVISQFSRRWSTLIFASFCLWLIGSFASFCLWTTLGHLILSLNRAFLMFSKMAIESSDPERSHPQPSASFGWYFGVAGNFRKIRHFCHFGLNLC